MSWKNILVSPGAGITTYSTGSTYKNSLWQKYYNSVQPDTVSNEWKNILSIIDHKTPKIFACPSDTGAGIIKGSNWGPLFLRQAMIDSGMDVEVLKKNDLGDILVNPHLLHDDLLNVSSVSHLRKSMYPDLKDDMRSQLPVSPLSQIDYLTQEIWKNHSTQKFLFLAGDHSCSYPIVKNWCLSRTHKNFALLHFDAHTDLLQERLGIPYCFGTWANQVLEFFPKPEHVVQVGIRASGKSKDHWEKTFGIKQHWAKDIQQTSIDSFIQNIIMHFQKCGIQEVYVSFDVDVLDPQYLSCTGTAEPEGIYPHHVAMILKALKNHFNISSIDVVEFAPFLRQSNIPKAQMEPETSLLTMQMLLPLFWESL
jgi:agmatinase